VGEVPWNTIERTQVDARHHRAHPRFPSATEPVLKAVTHSCGTFCAQTVTKASPVR
jgi:hypothetical protein